MHCFRRSSVGAAGAQQTQQCYAAEVRTCRTPCGVAWRSRFRPGSAAAATVGDAAASAAAASRPEGPLLLDSVRRSFKTRSSAPYSSKPGGSPRVCVLGAGVNGLATALRYAVETAGTAAASRAADCKNAAVHLHQEFHEKCLVQPCIIHE